VGQRIFARHFAALSALALASACADRADPPHADQQADPRPTLLSLNPCLDAIVVDIASPAQILALSHYSFGAGASIAPERAQDFAMTGGTAEEIIAAAPDIVLASTFIAPATRAALTRAGLRVETFASPRSVEQSAAQIASLGEIVGNREKARRLAQAISAPLTASPRTSGPSLLLWQPGQIVAGERTLIAQLIREAGFVSHAETLGLAQADHIALEQILANPPDVLLVAGESAGQRHPLLEQLQNTLVVDVDPVLLNCGGPTIAAVRAQLADVRTAYEFGQP